MVAASSSIDAVYRDESRRVLATLIRLLGSFELAEEAMSDAFVAAAQQWPQEGVPKNARAWLVSAGRFKAIDKLRRRARFDRSVDELVRAAEEVPEVEQHAVEDDQLRLVFVCCHPALAADAQVAMTLREVCGLTTEAIARAFLAQPTAIAQRIVRAKNRIRDLRLPYEVPDRHELAERLDSVLRTIYLVFNEGYSASSGDSVTRADLAAEAIRLTRLLAALLPEPEVLSLLALMLLQDSRRAARMSADGDLILIADQDRALWDRDKVDEGLALVDRVFRSRRLGPYGVQAAIAAVHAQAATAADTDWAEIAGLYDVLLKIDASPVVALNRAVAVAMRDGPEAGLRLIDPLAEGDLGNYQPAHASRADLLRRLGRKADARAAYERALQLSQQAPERRFLERRLAEL